MYEVKFVFKSGHAEKFLVKDFTAERNGLGQLVKITWKECASTKLMYINLGEVVGIFSKEVDAQDAVGK